jgi:hypothetical protein
MFGWIRDSLTFLFWLLVLVTARLVALLLCSVEVVGVLLLWPIGFYECRLHDTYWFLMLPIGATLFVMVQVALWQFTWLRLAQRGGRWRAMAECFSTVVRYPVMRTPHPWE